MSKLLKSAKSAKRSISVLDVKPVLLSIVNGSKSVIAVVVDVGVFSTRTDVFFGDVKLRRCVGISVAAVGCNDDVVTLVVWLLFDP